MNTTYTPWEIYHHPDPPLFHDAASAMQCGTIIISAICFFFFALLAIFRRFRAKNRFGCWPMYLEMARFPLKINLNQGFPVIVTVQIQVFYLLAFDLVPRCARNQCFPKNIIQNLGLFCKLFRTPGVRVSVLLCANQ